MCGIIGYTGNKNAVKIITNGLSKLEYRGYDSAGLAVFTQKGLMSVKTTGRVKELSAKTEKLSDEKIFCGIGHTRWATHGEPSERNCHPHGTNNVKVVHNGIIENYKELRMLLPDVCFTSDTDTEVIAHLMDREYKKSKDPIKAVINTQKLLKGSYALGIVFRDFSDTVFATRHDSPILIGIGDNENYAASDTAAFSEHTKNFLRLQDGDIAEITPDHVSVYDSQGREKQLNTETVTVQNNDDGKGTFSHHMLKEIYEEPEKMRDTFDAGTKNLLPTFNDEFFTRDIGSIYIIACGTALHSGLVGKYFIEKLSGIPVRTEAAGEFRYCEPVITKKDAAIIISQSGETADSLAALRMLKKQGIRTLAVVNAAGSTIALEAEKVIYTLAGKEVAVASTKAFNVQCQVLLFIAVRLGLIKNRLDTARAQKILKDHSDSFEKAIPSLLKNTSQFSPAVQILKNCKNVFFIGRGCDSYLGSEGSLKLKEISYIHSESFAASELKHGTISLIEKGTPVIAIATDERLYEKIRSNMLEVKSRGGIIIAVCPENAGLIRDVSDCCVLLPKTNSYALPFAAACALQLLAYYTALEMGRDIDKPRNLAKSVTVE